MEYLKCEGCGFTDGHPESIRIFKELTEEFQGQKHPCPDCFGKLNLVKY